MILSLLKALWPWKRRRRMIASRKRLSVGHTNHKQTPKREQVMSKQKMSAVADYLKKIATGVAQGVAINVVTEKVLPKAKKMATKVLDRMGEAQGRKASEDLERDPEAQGPVQAKPKTEETPTVQPPPVVNSDGGNVVDAKFE